MKKYEVTYGKSKVSYTAEKLESVARDFGRYDLGYEDARDGEYLSVAVSLFCSTHFMWAGSARMDSCDAATRGDISQSWLYQPNGAFRGWILATVKEA